MWEEVCLSVQFKEKHCPFSLLLFPQSSEFGQCFDDRFMVYMKNLRSFFEVIKMCQHFFVKIQRILSKTQYKPASYNPPRLSDSFCCPIPISRPINLDYLSQTACHPALADPTGSAPSERLSFHACLSLINFQTTQASLLPVPQTCVFCHCNLAHTFPQSAVPSPKVH